MRQATGDTTQDDLTALLEIVPIDVSPLTMKTNPRFTTALAYNMLKSMLKDGGGLVSLVADENSGDLIPDVPALSNFSYGALCALSHDSDEANTLSCVRSTPRTPSATRRNPLQRICRKPTKLNMRLPTRKSSRSHSQGSPSRCCSGQSPTDTIVPLPPEGKPRLSA